MKFITKNPLKKAPIEVERSIRDYKDGQVILHKDDTVESVSWVTDGWIKVYDFDVNGNEKILILLGPGDLLPVVWRDNVWGERRHNYEAITPVRLSRVERGVFENHLSDNKDQAKKVQDFSLNITHELLLRAESIEATSNNLRILQTLEYLFIKTAKKPNDKSVLVPFKITHEMIANMSGMTRESVSKVIKSLSKSGIVDYPSRSHLKIYKEPLHFALK